MPNEIPLSPEFAAFLKHNGLDELPLTGAQVIAANNALIEMANTDPQELARRLTARLAKGPLSPSEFRAVLTLGHFIDSARIAAYNKRIEQRQKEMEPLRAEMRRRAGEST